MKIVLLLLFGSVSIRGQQECSPESQDSFAIVTGYILNSAGGEYLIRTIPGVNSFSECLESCSQETSCLSVNFKTGLCMLFAAKPDSPPEGLVKSQYPIFSMFGWKTCIPEGTCSRVWSVEVVQNMELMSAALSSKHNSVGSLEECYQRCLLEREFKCRSANYYRTTEQCVLNKVNRFTESTMVLLQDNSDSDYIEPNCDSPSSNTCNFIEKKGFIIGTADAVLPNVKTVKECNTLCLEEKQFKCQTFDFNATIKGECRLSHHSSQSLQQLDEGYLEVNDALTYQLSSCYDVEIDCKADEMVAKVHTDKPFSGKIYAKNHPKSCVQDVLNSRNFELRLEFNDLECNIEQSETGKFSTSLIIQHHDQIITGMDLEVSISCLFNLYNTSIYSGAKISVNGDPEIIGNEEESFAISPTVTMQITDRKGHDVHSAKVGDALSLRFHILDNGSPYEIFVRELVANDGVSSSEILLIDSDGCPTDPTIMGPITIASQRKTPLLLEAPFDAFKFPTSEVVQFKALVIPCIPKCEPVNCSIEDYYGVVRKTESYGRRRRHLNDKESVVVQAIHIEDKFKFDTLLRSKYNKKKLFEDTTKFCLDLADIAIAFFVFLITQLIVLTLVVLKKQFRFTNIKTEKTKYIENTRATILPQFYRMS